ncbi:MAG TPA: hypothetical protein VKA73_05280 [Rubrobacter sp.]|nr:hypothetical protein [Rubrobacter sp.]
MTARLPGRREAVAVFSFEEEARMFLRLSRARAGIGPGGGDDGGWAVRPTYAGELASVLLDPCRRAGRVALDPLPGPAAAPVNALASMGCRGFLAFLLEGRPAPPGGRDGGKGAAWDPARPW